MTRCGNDQLTIQISRGGAARSARLAHNQEVASSNLAPATREKARVHKGLGLFLRYANKIQTCDYRKLKLASRRYRSGLKPSAPPFA